MSKFSVTVHEKHPFGHKNKTLSTKLQTEFPNVIYLIFIATYSTSTYSMIIRNASS